MSSNGNIFCVTGLCAGNSLVTRALIQYKDATFQYRKSHCGDKTVVRSSYLHNGISYTGKITSLYWIRAQFIPLTKASEVELWCFLWSVPLLKGWVNNRETGDFRCHCAHYDVIVMILDHVGITLDCNMNFILGAPSTGMSIILAIDTLLYLPYHLYSYWFSVMEYKVGQLQCGRNYYGRYKGTSYEVCTKSLMGWIILRRHKDTFVLSITIW